MAKASKPKFKEGEASTLPERCVLVTMTQDIVSYGKRAGKFRPMYAKAGDVAGIISVRDTLLLVACGYKYVVEENKREVRIKAPNTFPVLIAHTDFMRRGAEIINTMPEEEPELPKQRPSYGAPSSKFAKQKTRL